MVKISNKEKSRIIRRRVKEIFHKIEYRPIETNIKMLYEVMDLLNEILDEMEQSKQLIERMNRK